MIAVMRSLRLQLASATLVLTAGCSGSGGGASNPPDHLPAEDDWTLPAYVVASSNSALFSERAAPEQDVTLRVLDVSWRQLEPAKDVFSDSTADVVAHYEDLDFASLAAQRARPGDYWMRLWVSGVDVAPDWLLAECPELQPIREAGYQGDFHYPIWDPCVWEHAKGIYRELLLTQGLRADPALAFLYVPGAFTYSEFDFDLVESAFDDGDLTFAVFGAWFQQATNDLVAIMNGENADPGDDYAWKLVYTGEDFPFGPSDDAAGWHTEDDLLARDAVAKGMGIRTGITEVSNFHLSHVPAYGTTIAADGHMITDESWELFDGRRVIATENECYDACGFTTAEPYYAVKMSNLKALQLRMNHVYVVPAAVDSDPSFLAAYPELWRWLRLSLGKTAFDSPDAWLALREAEDRYFVEDPVHDWEGAPFVKNYERWIVQRDVTPGGVSRRGSEVWRGVLDPSNGVAFEGRSTDRANGSDALYFDVDERFLQAAQPVELKVTWRDEPGAGGWTAGYASAAGGTATAPVAGAGDGAWKTTTIPLTDATFDDTLPGSTDFRIIAAADADVEVRFVRIVKLTPP